MSTVLYNGRHIAVTVRPRRQNTGLGDKIARVATPIARALRLSCIDEATKELKPASPCGKAKARLNAGEPVLSVLAKRIRGE